MVSAVRTNDPRAILAEMARIVRAYCWDLGSLAALPFDGFFDFVRAKHYNREPHEWRAQILARPRRLLSRESPILACAAKSLLIASWAACNGIPWRFCAVGRRAGFPPHHVFAELQIAGEWVPCDATYLWSVPFLRRRWPVRVYARSQR